MPRFPDGKPKDRAELDHVCLQLGRELPHGSFEIHQYFEDKEKGKRKRVAKEKQDPRKSYTTYVFYRSVDIYALIKRRLHKTNQYYPNDLLWTSKHFAQLNNIRSGLKLINNKPYRGYTFKYTGFLEERYFPSLEAFLLHSNSGLKHLAQPPSVKTVSIKQNFNALEGVYSHQRKHSNSS
jgi:hypothetical protein